jgi:hypothetical protein
LLVGARLFSLSLLHHFHLHRSVRDPWCRDPENPF